MMKMVIGKKQIILSALVLALSIAVYINWQYAQTDGKLEPTSVLEGASAVSAPADGETQEVDADMDVESYGEAYFAEAKLNRTKSRDEAVETLTAMLQDAQLSSEQKAELALRAADLAESIEVEGKIENLIKAKGFAECMVYYDTDQLDVIVRSDGLSEVEAAQIWDVILGEVDLPEGNISIVEVK